MNRSAPFARAQAFMSALSMAISAGMSQAAALADLGGYESRGHGRSKYSGKKKGNFCSNWKESMNSPRECARRVRQRLARESKLAATV